MKIGDLFLRVLADDSGFTADLTAKAGAAGTSAGTSLGTKLSLALKTFGKDALAGLGLGAGIAAFGGLEVAASKAVGVMFAAVDAAKKDEESQSRLKAALAANIPGWDGNTKSIEALILSRQKLGFTDEEQRRSMALLVGATHDVTKAQNINRVAMDLARLKGISLEEASSALVKVEAGQYRALKALGIILPKNATAQDALNAVEKVATGQAEDYAKTNEGQVLVSQIKVNEALEKLGYKIMPVLTGALVALGDAAGPAVDALTAVGDAADGVAGVLDNLAGVNKEAAASSDWLGDRTTLLGQALHWLADQPGAVIDMINGTSDATSAAAVSFENMYVHVRDTMDDTAKTVYVHSRDTMDSLRSIGGAAQSGADKVKIAMFDIVSDIKGARSDLTKAASEAGSAIYDPIIAAAERARIATEIAGAQRVINSKNSSAAEVADAKAKLLDLKKAQIDNLALLASYGDKSAAAALKHQIDVLASTKHLSAEQRAELALLRAALAKTEASYDAAAAAAARLAAGMGGPSEHHRAAGGPVAAGQAYIVGERRPELFIPAVSGYIAPTTAGMAGAGGGNTYVANVQGLLRARDPGEVGAALRRLGDFGVLPDRPVGG